MSLPRSPMKASSLFSPGSLLLLSVLAAGCAAGAANVGPGGGSAGATTGSAGNPAVGAAGNGSPGAAGSTAPGTAGAGTNPGTAGINTDPGTAGSASGAAGASGSAGAAGASGSAGVTGAAGANPGTAGSSPGLGGMAGPCKPTTGGAALPASFAPLCSGCHSAFGAAANPLVPNLIAYAAAADTTEASFMSLVRMPKTGSIMPAFPSTALSDADVKAIYAYFKAGAPTGAVTCPGSDGTISANLGACSGMALTFSPLFTATSTPAQPVSYIDPTSHHLIFRGAGRVRFRHEMEATFAIYHDHYFEDRVFAYTLDDETVTGVANPKITITFEPTANQYYSKQTLAGAQVGGADLNIRFWKVYGGVNGNRFFGNAGGASNDVLPTNCATNPNALDCNTRKYTFVVKSNLRENRAIKVGDQLQVEFGMFIARYPGPDGKHLRNILPLPKGCTMGAGPYDNACYTQANYYSDSFRYVAGKGTVSPANEDCSMSDPTPQNGDAVVPHDCSSAGTVAKNVAAGIWKDRLGPAEAGWSGGSMTTPYLRYRHDLYLSQMSPAILGENAQAFVTGRRFFHTNFTTGNHIELNNGLMPEESAVHANLAGPLLNQLTCEGCHSHNNRGVPPAAGKAFDSVVVKLQGTGVDNHGAPNADPNYGKQLQNVALSGTAEGSGTFQFETVNGKFDDGTAYTLSKPTVSFTGLSAGPPVGYSIRLARPLVGMGLLEAIPEADLLAHADPTDCNNDGIKGVPNLVFDPEDGTMKVGRFGWKASKASVRHQVTEALNLDIGVTSSVFPKHDCGTAQAGCTSADKATPELSDGDVAQLVTYMRTLGLPPRRDLNDPQVMRGESLFATMGCVGCHQPNQHTGTAHPFIELQNQVIHPYSDLLLHDMGADLADNTQGEFVAKSTMWRTPPLWTIGLCDEVAAGFQDDQTLNPAPNNGPCHYLHDGRAATLLEAVLWHGGEADAVKKRVLALSAADRTALVAFLKSL
jgi:CxxC motif-containing protein (DUF1111 family)/cytochrome c553